MKVDEKDDEEEEESKGTASQLKRKKKEEDDGFDYGDENDDPEFDFLEHDYHLNVQRLLTKIKEVDEFETFRNLC